MIPEDLRPGWIKLLDFKKISVYLNHKLECSHKILYLIMRFLLKNLLLQNETNWKFDIVLQD